MVPAQTPLRDPPPSAATTESELYLAIFEHSPDAILLIEAAVAVAGHRAPVAATHPERTLTTLDSELMSFREKQYLRQRVVLEYVPRDIGIADVVTATLLRTERQLDARATLLVCLAAGAQGRVVRR